MKAAAVTMSQGTVASADGRDCWPELMRGCHWQVLAEVSMHEYRVVM